MACRFCWFRYIDARSRFQLPFTLSPVAAALLRYSGYYLSPGLHNSQALAGFGIAAGATPDTSQEKGGDDVFSAFSEGDGATAALSSCSNIQGGLLSGSGGGGGGLKGERGRVGSVDVSDLLRATRLRVGGRRGSRPAVRGKILRFTCITDF